VARYKKKGSDFSEPFLFVRVKGLEPPRLAAPDPKSGASANFATPATTTKHNGFFGCGKPKTKLSSPWHCFGMDRLEEILGKTRLLARTEALYPSAGFL
jgi:hypothetical protein